VSDFGIPDGADNSVHGFGADYTLATDTAADGNAAETDAADNALEADGNAAEPDNAADGAQSKKSKKPKKPKRLTIFGDMRADRRAALVNDPSARNGFEVALTYSGFHALIMHRYAHFFHKHGWKLFARIISQTARFFTGVEIHPGATLGNGIFIDHGMGVVIGETAEVGNGVVIYQGVTLGGTGKERGKRHPTIGDNVMISSGAKILGPFTVGANSKIGAGSVVLKEVPAGSTVVGVPGRVVKQGGQRLADLDQVRLPDPVGDDFARLYCQVESLYRMIESHNNEQDGSGI
jgi:serine O-acetyltransferase